MNGMADMTIFIQFGRELAGRVLRPDWEEFLPNNFLSYGLRKGKFRCAEPQAGVSGTDNPSAELN